MCFVNKLSLHLCYFKSLVYEIVFWTFKPIFLPFFNYDQFYCCNLDNFETNVSVLVSVNIQIHLWVINKWWTYLRQTFLYIADRLTMWKDFYPINIHNWESRIRKYYPDKSNKDHNSRFRTIHYMEFSAFQSCPLDGDFIVFLFLITSLVI